MRLNGFHPLRNVEFLEQTLLLREIDVEVGRKKVSQLSASR